MFVIINNKKRNFVIEILNIKCIRRSFIETKIIRMAKKEPNSTNSDAYLNRSAINPKVMKNGTPIRKLTTNDTFIAFIHFISKKSLSTILSTIKIGNKSNIRFSDNKITPPTKLGQTTINNMNTLHPFYHNTLLLKTL